VDKNGNKIIPLKYDSIGIFSEGLAGVSLNGKCGFVDLQGNEVIPLKYDSIGIFRNGRAFIQIGDIWAEVDLNGKEHFKQQDRAKLRENKIQRLLKGL
jgi:hypothetical protein